MKNRKGLVAVLCLALLVVGVLAGTLAYFTDQEAVVNTFTVGKVGIELHESDEVSRDDGTVGKDYHLLPGHTYPKDPTVTVDADSELSYIRMLVTPSRMTALKAAFPDNEADEVFLLENLVAGWDSAVWQFAGYKNDTYEFRYYKAVDGSAGELKPLFTHVVIPGSVNNEELAKLQGLKIDVVAHAIQAAGFDSADAAWAAFEAQHS